MIGKRKGLISSCKEEEKERILWFIGAVWTVSQEREVEERREEKGWKEPPMANVLLCSKHSILLTNSNFFWIHWEHVYIYIYKDSFLY